MNAPDIHKRIESDFGRQSGKAKQILNAAISRHECLNNERIIRCVLYLSQNSIEELVQQLSNAATDYRDVIVAAEYDNDATGLKRTRDFNNPFDK